MNNPMAITPEGCVLAEEALILLLQDLHDRKKSTNSMKNYARSLLDRLGAPYAPEAEQVPTKEETPSQIGSNWLDGLGREIVDEINARNASEQQGRDGLGVDVSALIAERNRLADQLADAVDTAELLGCVAIIKQTAEAIDRQEYWDGQGEGLQLVANHIYDLCSRLMEAGTNGTH